MGQQTSTPGVPVQEGRIVLRYLLLGKTGTGKSETGNSIMKSQCFKVSHSGDSETTGIQTHFVQHEEYDIQISDGLCLQSNQFDKARCMQNVINDLTQLMVRYPEGFTAFLVFVKFGNRFTAEDRQLLESLGQLFGQDFLKDYGIVIVTCGDHFYKQKEKGVVLSFDRWIHNEVGDLGWLFAECNFRCVLFNNNETNDIMNKSQINKLIRFSLSITDAYSKEVFDRNTAQHQNIIELLKKEDKYRKSIADLYRSHGITANPTVQENNTLLNSTAGSDITGVADNEVTVHDILPSAEFNLQHQMNLLKGSVREMRNKIDSFDQQLTFISENV